MKQMHKGSVLMTDGQQRKTLAAVRSLGRQGIKILVGEDTRWATAAFSKYCSRAVVYPSPQKEPQHFLEKMLEVIKQYQVQTIFPMDDGVLELVVKNQEVIQDYCSVLLPEKKHYEIAADKGLATEMVYRLGVDCPKSIHLNKNGVFQALDEVDKRWHFPIVIKPRKSSGSRGIHYLPEKRSAGELHCAYNKVHHHYPFPFLQECVPSGTKYDVCLLYDQESKLIASFVQKEIRHFPLNKGPSTLQESVWRPDLVEKADAVMRKLNWKGIAEVEFMQDPRDGKEKFMEINPRFWGSLHLAILAGVDFPWLFYQLAIGQAVEKITHYKVGIRCRWLLPGDILHFISNSNRRQMEPSFFAGKKMGVYDDIISKQDIMPFIGFSLAVLHYLPDIGMWKKLLNR